MEFYRVDAADEAAVLALSRLATKIVKEHYDPIIGAAQNDYMIEKFQSVEAIRAQLEAGYRYYTVEETGETIGFLAFYPRNDALYLSKFYLDKDARGKGYARQMLDFVCAAAREAQCGAVELNVNIHNPSIYAYEKMGFSRIRSEKNAIGSGYYMDDYVYRLTV